MATFDRVIPLLVYQDIEAAHDFLAEAFGFAPGGWNTLQTAKQSMPNSELAT